MSFFDQLMTLVGAKEATPETPASSLASGGGAGSKVRMLSAETKAELQKGIVYNMKVVLRGMPGVGKTTILSRLCGYPLTESYVPSTEVMTGIIRIRGSNCAPQEGTKVDIWDIVDEGRTDAALRLPPHIQSSKDSALMRQEMINVLNSCVADAQNLDVYQNCHMAIFVIDCTRPETFAYACRHAAQVPPSVCLLLALNFSDVPPAQQKVSLAEVRTACAKLRRTVSPFMQRVLLGHTAPEQLSVGVTSLAISARTGEGMNDFLRFLDTPNMLLQIAVREADLQRRYSELGWLHDKKSASPTGTHEHPAPASNLDAQPLSSAPETRAQPGTTATVPRSELKLSNYPATTASAKPRETDQNEIEKGFFNDSDDEEEEEHAEAEEEEEDNTEEEESEEEEGTTNVALVPPTVTTPFSTNTAAERPVALDGAAAPLIDGSVADTSVHDFLDDVEELPDTQTTEASSPPPPPTTAQKSTKPTTRLTLTPLVSVKTSSRNRSQLPSLLEKAKGCNGPAEQVEVNVDAMVNAMKASLEKSAVEDADKAEGKSSGTVHEHRHKSKKKAKHGYAGGENEPKLDGNM